MQFTVQSLRRRVVVRASRVAVRVPTQGCQVRAETSHILLPLNKKNDESVGTDEICAE